MKKQDPNKLKKVMIVIEETGTGEGLGYNVYLAGDTAGINLPSEEQTAAEFYGAKFFTMIINKLKEIGAIKTEHKRH